MKKICFITTISSTLKTFVLETAKYLHEFGDYDITMVCHYDEEFEGLLPDYIQYYPLKMRRGVNFDGVKAIWNLYHLFRKERFGIVQYSTPNASFYASIASSLARIPVRLYCQWGILYVGSQGWKRTILKTLEKITCSLSTWVEPDSFGNLEFSHQEGLYSNRKSSVVYNGSAKGIDLHKFNYNFKQSWNKEIRSKYQIAEDDYVIGFIGRITKDKGFNELLIAMRKLLERNTQLPLKLMVIGNNTVIEGIQPELYEWSLNEKNIIYCGHTNEVEKYYAAMDVFILPSYREGFGSVVIEAEAMGIPVIVTDIPGPLDAMIENETGIVVKKQSIDQIVEAVECLVNSPSLAEGMGLNGRQFVTSKFDAEILKQEILHDRDRLLEQVLVKEGIG